MVECMGLKLWRGERLSGPPPSFDPLIGHCWFWTANRLAASMLHGVGVADCLRTPSASIVGRLQDGGFVCVRGVLSTHGLNLTEKPVHASRCALFFVDLSLLSVHT